MRWPATIVTLISAQLAAGCNSSNGPLDAPVGSDDLGWSGVLDGAAEPDLAALAPMQCGRALPRYVGSLCGPPTNPCTVLRSEVVDTTQSTGSFSPAIAVGRDGAPLLFYQFGGQVGGTPLRGRFAAWESGAWAVIDPPAKGLTAALASDSRGAVHAVIYDGFAAPGTRPVRDFIRAGGKWAGGAALDALPWIRDGAIVFDDADCIHAVSGSAPALSLFQGDGHGWSVMPIVSDGAGAQIALSPRGRPHAVAYSVWNGAVQIYWTAPPAWDVIDNTDGPFLPGEPALVAVTGDDEVGQPHILYLSMRAFDARNTSLDLRHATRLKGSWQITNLVAEALPLGCDDGPTMPGQTCARDQEWGSPAAIVVNGAGEVRLLYLHTRNHQPMDAVCDGKNPPSCTWRFGPATQESKLMLAWFEAGALQRQELHSAIALAAARAVLDDSGRIHVVLYEGDRDGAERVLHLEIGAR